MSDCLLQVDHFAAAQKVHLVYCRVANWYSSNDRSSLPGSTPLRSRISCLKSQVALSQPWLVSSLSTSRLCSLRAACTSKGPAPALLRMVRSPCSMQNVPQLMHTAVYGFDPEPYTLNPLLLLTLQRTPQSAQTAD